ncbi:MAG: threonine/serine exporter family protein [Ruminococcus sp.]|nr:threonine/serine exporter family protein [Ruminococcus sp.]
MTMIIEFIVAFFATAAFAVLFSVQREQWFFAGLTGSIGWLVYLLFSEPMGSAIATFLAVLVITFLSRIFAVIRKAPVTIFLVSGIFPLVPGVGIYYTSYYFIMEDFTQAVSRGVDTLKIAMAIALGIMFMLSIPQKFFHLFEQKK